jgi:hypothetical protein
MEGTVAFMSNRNLLDYYDQPFQDSVLAQYKTVNEQVRFILARYPEAKDNDFYLTVLYLRIFCKIKVPYVEWREMNRLSGRLDVVRRNRQKIQNEEHDYESSMNVKIQRARHRRALEKVLVAANLEEKLTV